MSTLHIRLMFLCILLAFHPSTGGAQPQKQSPSTEWEYAVVECVWQKGVYRALGPGGQVIKKESPGTNPVVYATELGAQGWELVSAIPGGNVSEPLRKETYTLIFKRPKQK